MPMSDYVRRMRATIGNDLLLVPTVNILMFDAQNRVLLIRPDADGLWTTPGGMVEPYETPADAAMRAMWENTGLTVELTRVIGVFGGMECSVTYGNQDQMSFVSTVFAARRLPTEIAAEKAGERASAQAGDLRGDLIATLAPRYFAQKETAGLACYPHVADALRVAFANGPTYFRPPRWQPPR